MKKKSKIEVTKHMMNKTDAVAQRREKKENKKQKQIKKNKTRKKKKLEIGFGQKNTIRTQGKMYKGKQIIRKENRKRKKK